MRENPAVRKTLEDLKPLSEEEVISRMYQPGHEENVALSNEMARRQLVTSRELTQAMREADRSARHAAKWLNRFTVALVILGVALLLATVALLGLEFVRLVNGR